MVLPFGPAEKQALLEAAESTARAKLLVAFLEMNALRPGIRNAAQAGRINSSGPPASGRLMIMRPAGGRRSV